MHINNVFIDFDMYLRDINWDFFFSGKYFLTEYLSFTYLIIYVFLSGSGGGGVSLCLLFRSYESLKTKSKFFVLAYTLLSLFI